MCKCRCGSDDKLKLKDGIFVRAKDNEPHYCKYSPKKVTQTTTTQAPDSTQPGLKEDTNLVTKVTAAFHEIHAIEQILKDVDDTLANNPPKLGMYIKLVSDKLAQVKQ